MVERRIKNLTLLIATGVVIVLCGCNQQNSDKQKLSTFYCNYIKAVEPAAKAMTAFETAAKEDASYLMENIFEMPKEERKRRINNILSGNDIFLITLNSSISKLQQLDTIIDTVRLKQETLLTFYITEDFLSTDFKTVCITLRDSFEVLPEDYFDNYGYFGFQQDKLKYITMRNNAVGDLQMKFFESHGLTEEDMIEIINNCK